MHAIVQSLQELVRIQEDMRLNRRGGAASGLLVTILAVIGLIVVLSAIF